MIGSGVRSCFWAFFSRSLLVVLSLAVGAAALEGAARLLVWKWSREPHTYLWPLLTYHPVLGWAKPAGQRGWIRRERYHVELRINSLGLRGPERGYQKPPGVRRVLLLGDSFTEGFTVAERHTVRAVLERALGERLAHPVEVLNAGTLGYDTAQEYLFFVREGYRYQPDVVVLLFFFNDLIEAGVPGYSRPMFTLAGDRLELGPLPVAEPDPAVVRDLRRGYRLKPLRGSMALRFVANRARSGNPKLNRMLAGWGLAEHDRGYGDSSGLWPFGPPRQVAGSGLWNVPAALLEALRDTVRGHGARLLVFYVPAAFEIDVLGWEHLQRLHDLGRRWTRDGVIERLRGVTRELGVELVDPRSAMRNERAALYVPGDGHWNERGNRVAAQQIAERVIQKRMLAAE